MRDLLPRGPIGPLGGIFNMEEKTPEEELRFWLDFYENRPIRDVFMIDFLRAVRVILEKLEDAN